MANYQSQYTGEQIDEAVGKVGKALVTPDTSPSSVVIPAIGTDNAQTNLTLGDGLTVADGVISASGGGSGGVKLYKHIIRFYDGSSIKGGFSGYLTHNNPVTSFGSFINQDWIPVAIEPKFVRLIYSDDELGTTEGIQFYRLLNSTGFEWQDEILKSYTVTDDDISEL